MNTENKALLQDAKNEKVIIVGLNCLQGSAAVEEAELSLTELGELVNAAGVERGTRSKKTARGSIAPVRRGRKVKRRRVWKRDRYRPCAAGVERRRLKQPCRQLSGRIAPEYAEIDFYRGHHAQL